MKGAGFRGGLSGWALLAAAVLSAAPALAQTPAANVSPPPEKFAVSPGGVDMRSGRYAYSQTDVDIGGESGGLALTRSLPQQVVGHNNPFGNFSHNWDVLISEKRINVQQSVFTHSPGMPDYQMEVSFGGRSQTFRAEGANGGFDQTSRSGFASLTVSGTRSSASAVYTYRTGDGTEVVFRQIGSGDCSSVLRCAYASQVTEADGTVLTLEYDNAGSNATRLRSVTSSRGYALLLEYSGGVITKACVLNLTTTTKPSNNVCPAGALATTTYAYSGANLTAATDASGAAWGFSHGAYTRGFLRPGAGSAWLTNTIHARTNDDGLVEEIVDSQAFVDGSSFTYGWGESPVVMGHVPEIAGGSFANNLGHVTTLEYSFPTRPFSPAQGHGDLPADGSSPVVHQVTPGPTSVTDPLGRVTTYDYCDPWLMANAPPGWMHRCMVMPRASSTTDPMGIRTEIDQDMYARTVLQTRQIASGGGLANIVRSATYDCTPANFRFCARPVTQTDANGNVTTYSYDAAHGGLISETGPAVGGVQPQTRHIYAQRTAWISNGAGGYTAGATIWVRTATSSCRTSAATGNPAAPCATTGDEVLTQYDYGPNSGPNNLLLRGQTVTADGVTLRTCYAYDDRGRRIGETLPGAALTACTGTESGAAAFTTAQRHDAMNRVTGTIAPDPDGAGSLHFAATRSTYDAAGNLTKVETGELAAWPSASTAPASWTGFTIFRIAETQYDAMGRKTRDMLKRPDGTIETLTQYSYDAIGRLECTAVRMNPAIYGSLPSSACTAGTAGSDGPDRIARTIYDAAGQRLQLREGVGSTAEGTEATWAYNADGQVTTVIDGNGNRATLQYDGHGRQTGWTFPSTTRATAFDDSTPALALSTAGGVGSLYEGYAYDPNGNRTNLLRRDGRNIAFAYDALNRVTAKTYPQGGATAVYYGYDLRGLQTFARFTSSTGEGITNIFDGFGRLTSTSSNMGGNTRALAYQYDPNGNRTRITHPDGNYFNTTYDGLNRPVALLANGSTTIAATEYYAHGGPWVVNRIGQATEINYDLVQRPYVLHHYLPTAGDVYWVSAFNPASQIASTVRTNDAYAWTSHYATTRAYTTNGLNQYSAATGISFGYDANGNLTASGSSNYVYDIENRLVGAPGNIALTYDPLGRLFQVANTSSGAATQFLYDGDAMVAEYNGSNVLQRRHVHNVGADVPMATYAVSGGTGLGTISQLFADRQGSIVAQLTSGGVNAGLNTYDEYGIPGASNSGRFQYTGQIWLAELGMYHYKARVYSPYLGRFMQTDPVGYDDQFNLYAYVGNDPVNGADSSGMIKNCQPTDPTCIETPESGQQPGEPPAESEEEKQAREVVVVATRPPINHDDMNEEFFVIFNHQMNPREMRWRNVTCPSGRSIRMGSTASLPAGSIGAHSHGNNAEQHPGPRDDSAARGSTSGVAAVMTHDRSFTIRHFSNGTFRTRQTEGPPLSAGERAELVANMRNWEQRPDPGSGSSDAARVCP